VARAAGARRLVLTHFRASRFADPEELADEAASAFGGPVEAARDLDAFDF
jgi:ribonuclease BN (tRNA processing enzyme)